MATFTAFQALDMSALDLTFDSGSTVAIASSTQLRIVDGTEVTDVFGTGFTYDAQSRFTAGTITRIEQSVGGTQVFRLDGSYNAPTVAGFLDDGPAGAAGLRAFLLSGNDQITGSAGADALFGLAGNDVLNGGGGNDTMAGGTGSDSYVVNTAGDVVIEEAGAGTDVVSAAISYTLGANVERLNLLGSSDLDGTGNTLSNVLIGNAGANTLTGGAGNDAMDGGTGIDTMVGGTGNDIYTVNVAGDVVTEGAGAGIDTVRSTVSYTLGANLERLTLTGSAAINGAGNALSNILVGNAAANRLTGGDGNDVLDGGDGDNVVIQ
jgi:Ca2+-binding RTX toxin-like protein